MNTNYRVTVGAYGWAGEGRPSMPRDISTAPHGKNLWAVEILKLMLFFLYGSFVNIFHWIHFLSVPLDMCMPPSPPTQPVVMAVSDTELALSWQQGESEGSAPVLHFLVAYIRSVIEWRAPRKQLTELYVYQTGLLWPRQHSVATDTQRRIYSIVHLHSITHRSHTDKHH